MTDAVNSVLLLYWTYSCIELSQSPFLYKVSFWEKTAVNIYPFFPLVIYFI